MADPREVLRKLDEFVAQSGQEPPAQPRTARDVLAKFDAARGVQGYQGPMRQEGSSLAVAPGTTPEEAARIPRGMVFDPQTGGYVDTAAMAERTVARNGAAPFLGNVGAGILGAGEYLDEAVGAVDSAVTGRSPEVGAEYVREVQDRSSTTGELAGRLAGGAVSVVGAIGAAKTIATQFPRLAALASSFAPQGMTFKVGSGAAAGAAAGAIEGGVAGFGAGNDGDRTARAGQQAGMGAMIGGAAGGAAPLAGAAAGGIYNALKDNFSRVSRRIPGLSPTASNLIRDVGDADSLGSNPLANIRRAGPDAMPADFGPATQDLLDTSVSMSSAGRQVAGSAVNDRAARAMPRLNQAFDDAMGGPQGVGALRTAVTDASRPGINAAYRDAYGTPIDYASAEGRRLEGIVARIPPRIFNQAASKARERMDWEGIPYQYISEIGEDGAARIRQIPSVTELDYLKRALDDIVSDGTDGITGKLSSDAQLARNMKVQLRDALGGAVPAYRTALNEASDAFSLNESIELGTNLLKPNTTRERVSEWARTATPVERQALVSGLRSDIDETIANVRRSVTAGDIEVGQARRILRDMSSRAAREKMVQALGPDEARRVFRAMNQATEALNVQSSVARNSMTAPRMRRDQLVRDAQSHTPAQVVRDAASGNLVQAPQKAAAMAANNTPLAQNKRTEELYLEVAEYLTGRRGPDALRAAEEMLSAARSTPVQSGNSQAISRAVSATVPAVGYPAATQAQRTGPR